MPPCYRECLARRRPTYSISRVEDPDGKEVSCERLLLSFGEDDSVRQIVGSYKAISIDGGFKVDNLMDVKRGVPTRIVNAAIDLELAPQPAGVRACDDIIVTDTGRSCLGTFTCASCSNIERCARPIIPGSIGGFWHWRRRLRRHCSPCIIVKPRHPLPVRDLTSWLCPERRRNSRRVVTSASGQTCSTSGRRITTYNAVCRCPHRSASPANFTVELVAISDQLVLILSSAPAEVSAEYFGSGAPSSARRYFRLLPHLRFTSLA